MGNIHVKFYGIWINGSKGDVVKRHFLSRALTAPLFSRPKPFMQFWQKVSYEEQFCEIILNLGQWFRSRCCLKDFLSGALVALLFG